MRDLIRKTRKKKGLTQQELANKAGVSFSSLAKFEGGFTNKPYFEFVQKICKALDLDVNKITKKL